MITVTGKAFYDVAHAPANHSNQRTNPKDHAVWEIRPLMTVHLDQKSDEEARGKKGSA